MTRKAWRRKASAGERLDIGGDESHRRSESKTPKVIPIVIQVVDCIRNCRPRGPWGTRPALEVSPIQANGAIPVATDAATEIPLSGASTQRRSWV